MEYKVLSTEEQNKIVVEFMLAQERDYYCLEVNKARYDDMLKDVTFLGAFRAKIESLKTETEQRMSEVEKIITATVKQLPTAEEIALIKSEL